MNEFLCNLCSSRFNPLHSNTDDIELHTLAQHRNSDGILVLAHFTFSMADILLKFTSCMTITNFWTPLNPHARITVCIISISYVLSNGLSLLYYMQFPCVVTLYLAIFRKLHESDSLLFSLARIQHITVTISFTTNTKVCFRYLLALRTSHRGKILAGNSGSPQRSGLWALKLEEQ